MGKRMKLLTGQIFSVSKGGIKWRYVFKKVSWVIFFSKEKLDSTRPPRRQPRNSLPNWIFITSGHFVVNYEGRCKKKIVSPYLESACQLAWQHPPTSGSEMFVSLRTKKIFSRRVNGWGVKNLEQVQPSFSKCKQNPGEMTLLKDF